MSHTGSDFESKAELSSNRIMSAFGHHATALHDSVMPPAPPRAPSPRVRWSDSPSPPPHHSNVHDNNAQELGEQQQQPQPAGAYANDGGAPSNFTQRPPSPTAHFAYADAPLPPSPLPPYHALVPSDKVNEARRSPSPPQGAYPLQGGGYPQGGYPFQGGGGGHSPQGGSSQMSPQGVPRHISSPTDASTRSSSPPHAGSPYQHDHRYEHQHHQSPPQGQQQQTPGRGRSPKARSIQTSPQPQPFAHHGPSPQHQGELPRGQRSPTAAYAAAFHPRAPPAPYLPHARSNIGQQQQRGRGSPSSSSPRSQSPRSPRSPRSPHAKDHSYVQLVAEASQQHHQQQHQHHQHHQSYGTPPLQSHQPSRSLSPTSSSNSPDKNLDPYGSPEAHESVTKSVALAAVIEKMRRSPPSPRQQSPTGATLAHWLPRIAEDGRELQHAPRSLREHFDTVRMAVRQDWRALEYASSELKGDGEIVLTAIMQDWQAIHWASPQLQRSRPIVLAAVKRHWRAIQYAPSSLMSDEAILMEAVAQNYMCLEFAAAPLRADREFMLHAVNVHPKCLKYAASSIRDDKDIVLRAVSKNGNVVKYASPSLQHDRDVMLMAVSQAGSALKYGSDDLKRDESIVLRAVSNDGAALRYASEHLREAKCRRGHALASFQAPWEGWYCSECAQHLSPTQRIDKFKAGSLMHGCRPCEYDLCHDCFQARTFSPEKAKADSSIALAAVDSLMSSMLTNVSSRGSSANSSPTKNLMQQNPEIYGASSSSSPRSPTVLQPSPGSVRIVANKGFVFNRGGDKTSTNTSASSSNSSPMKSSSSSPGYNTYSPHSSNSGGGVRSGSTNGRGSPTSSPNNNGRTSPTTQQLTARGEALFGTHGNTYWQDRDDGSYPPPQSSAIPGVSSYYASPSSLLSTSGYTAASSSSAASPSSYAANSSGSGVPSRQASLYPRVEPTSPLYPADYPAGHYPRRHQPPAVSFHDTRPNLPHPFPWEGSTRDYRSNASTHTSPRSSTSPRSPGSYTYGR